MVSTGILTLFLEFRNFSSLTFTDSPGNITSAVKSDVEESLEQIVIRKQLKLIEELTAFIDHLRKTLLSCSSTKIESACREPKTSNVLQQRFMFRKVNFRARSLIGTVFRMYN